jgi:hypothetical protein
MLLMDIASDKCASQDESLHAFIPARGSIRAETNGRERPQPSEVTTHVQDYGFALVIRAINE